VVPSAEGLHKYWLHLLWHAEDEAAPLRGEEETARRGEEETEHKACIDDNSAVKASQLNNADCLFGFSH
jgi:hypothetical protein